MRTFIQARQCAAPAITVELGAAADRDVAALCASARRFSPYADAFVVSANSSNRPVSPVALAALILREGIDPIPRLSRRGLNRIAQLGDLLGLRALGVTSLLLGEEPGAEIRAGETQPFSVREAELIGVAKDLSGTDWDGKSRPCSRRCVRQRIAHANGAGRPAFPACSPRARTGSVMKLPGRTGCAARDRAVFDHDHARPARRNWTLRGTGCCSARPAGRFGHPP